MPSITVNGGTGSGLNYTSNDAVGIGNALAQQITSALTGGGFTSFNYTAGATPNLAPSPPSGSGAVTFTAPNVSDVNGNPVAVFIPAADSIVVDSANGPLSVQGGAAGGTFLAGAGLAGAPRNVTYTNITPTGSALDQIAVLGGNNLIQTQFSGGGNYNIGTGSGNDTVNVLTGNATVNAGTGVNQVNVGTGSNTIYSEGYDTITGSGTGGGYDTVNIGSGQTSINSGSSNFLINHSSGNQLQVTLGFGVDTINYGGAAPGVLKGINSSGLITGVGTVVATDTGTGDGVTVTGSANATVRAGAGNETIVGQGTSGSTMFMAGTGNDTLYAGQGAATLGGAIGGAASALLISGPLGSTTFSFVNGQSGGSDTISGFKANDILSFSGFGSDPQGTAIVAAGRTIITLSDGTTIQVYGATPSAGQFRIS